MRGGTNFSSVMTEIATHEDEGVRITGCAGEAGEMSNIVARCIEKVERTISEKVICSKSANGLQ
jgi:hypothetical protein